MATFKDSQGQTWTLAITIGVARRLKSLPENAVDLLAPASLQVTLDDLYSRFDLIWQLCRHEAEERGIKDDEAFGRLLADAESFASVNVALREALADFFLRAGRPELARLVDRAAEASERLQTLAISKIDSPEVTAAIELAFSAAENAIDAGIKNSLDNLGTKSTSSPEPAE